MRFFEKSVAHFATVDIDNSFHRLHIAQSWLNGSVWNLYMLAFPALQARTVPTFLAALFVPLVADLPVLATLLRLHSMSSRLTTPAPHRA